MGRLSVLLAELLPAAEPIPKRQLQDPTECVSFRFQELSGSTIQQVIHRCCVNL